MAEIGINFTYIWVGLFLMTSPKSLRPGSLRYVVVLTWLSLCCCGATVKSFFKIFRNDGADDGDEFVQERGQQALVLPPRPYLSSYDDLL